MSTGDAFRTLSDLLQDLESAGCEVTAVDAPSGGLLTDDAVDVQVDVSFTVFDREGSEDVDIEVSEFDLRGDGTAHAQLSVSVGRNESGETASLSPNGSRTESETDAETLYANTDGGRNVAEADEEPADTEGEPTGESEEHDAADPLEGETDTEDGPGDAPAGSTVPDHRDPERLREVYERYGTFAEMTDALGTDVTAQTVRHHMINHGIHEPSTQTADPSTDAADDEGRRNEPDDEPPHAGDEEGLGDHDDPEPSIPARAEPGADAPGTDEDDHSDDLPELVDLPEGIELEDVKSAVRSSSTLFEVQRQLDTDRERTRELLRDLGLLKFVTGRLAKKRNQDSSLERIDGGAGSTDEIDERIRAAVASSASS